jgi:translation initiation factor IF-3
VRIEDAIRLAQEADLDLVEVAPNSKPPVAKIMGFGKFKYETAQKAKEAKRNQSNTILKEVRFRLKIDVHDYETKRKRAEGFLKAGDKVKAMILFRGREQSRPEQGVRLLQRFAEDVAELGTVESTPTIDGRNMVMVIGPLKTKAEVKAETDANRVSSKPPREERDHGSSESHADAPAAATEAASAPKQSASKPAAEPVAEEAPKSKAPAAAEPKAEAPKAQAAEATAPKPQAAAKAPTAPKAAATPKAPAPKAPAAKATPKPRAATTKDVTTD